jgi:hypothetical protein
MKKVRAALPKSMRDLFDAAENEIGAEAMPSPRQAR